MVRGSEFAVITTRFSTWKPNPNFPNDKSDGWMLWPSLTTESNTTKEWNVLSDALSRPPDLSTTELFTGEENARQTTDENIRLSNLTATGMQIDDSAKKALIHDYKNDPAFSRHILESELPFVEAYYTRTQTVRTNGEAATNAYA
jgi:hypothetical protein